jgi:hypothetical protein
VALAGDAPLFGERDRRDGDCDPQFRFAGGRRRDRGECDERLAAAGKNLERAGAGRAPGPDRIRLPRLEGEVAGEKS